MSRLTEKYVQDVSLEYLRNYYIGKCNPDKMICQKEVMVKYKGKRGRADGFIAFENEKQKYYTVSLEAKSHKTLKSLITQYKHITTISIGLIILGLVFVFMFNLLYEYSWFIKTGISIFGGIFICFGVFVFIVLKGYLMTHNIIDQVKRYPANEQWVAFSKDSYNKLNSNNIFELKQSARRYGIGMIIVSKNKKIQIEIYPESNNTRRKKNYYKHYLIASKNTNDWNKILIATLPEKIS